MRQIKFKKYRDNLTVVMDSEGNGVIFSYGEKVATITGKTATVFGWWSKTTSKHINYVCKELALTKKEASK